MTNEQCTNVAKTAWNLANEPDTDFAASVALRDCAVTIKELQARIAELEKDAARYRFLKENHLRIWKSNLAKNYGEKSFDFGFEAKGDDVDTAIDTAMQKD